MSKTIAFNGKFFGAAPTGVHRVAEELIAAADAWIAEKPKDDDRYALMARTDVKVPPYRNIACVRESPRVRWMHRIAWEQFYLPMACRKDFLLNLCNIGPLFHRASATMIHDAQVYSTPGSYSRPFRLWYKFAFSFIGRYHKLIFTVSEFSKQELVRYGIAAADKIVVIHNGCDHILQIQPDDSLLAKFKLQSGRYVVALANTQKHKNVGILLKAFATPELADVALVLFGSAKKVDFENIGHAVPPNVTFAGRTSDAELAGLIANAGALAFPSLTEGFGLPPLEAMALGCPVVAAPFGALPEVCGEAALYADPFSEGEWSAQIRSAIDDETMRQSLVAKGHRQAGIFTWKRAAQNLIEAVQTVMPSRGA
jgi:glycosyltransferase involved in cell wall biosynthesis